MASARQLLGPLAQALDGIEGDIATLQLPAQASDLGHDRAVFHLVATPARRTACAGFGMPFTLLRHGAEEHLTPRGGTQKFIDCHCRKAAA